MPSGWMMAALMYSSVAEALLQPAAFWITRPSSV
jgi:hypothetical protein